MKKDLKAFLKKIGIIANEKQTFLLINFFEKKLEQIYQKVAQNRAKKQELMKKINSKLTREHYVKAGQISAQKRKEKKNSELDRKIQRLHVEQNILTNLKLNK